MTSQQPTLNQVKTLYNQITEFGNVYAQQTRDGYKIVFHNVNDLSHEEMKRGQYQLINQLQDIATTNPELIQAAQKQHLLIY